MTIMNIIDARTLGICKMDDEANTLTLTMSARRRLDWEVAENDALDITKDEDGNEYLSNGEEKIQVIVEKQVHNKIDATYKVYGTKVGEYFLKVNFVNKKKVYEIWTNHPDFAIGRSGQRVKQKMCFRSTSEKSTKAKYNKMLNAMKKAAKEA